MENQIILYEEKAKELCHTILDAYASKAKIFSNPNIEESMHPEKMLVDAIKDSNEKKARWLFFACANMQRKNSATYFSDFREAYVKNPGLLDNEKLENFNIWRKCISPFLFEYSEDRFKLNNERLLEKYNGNPLKIIEQSADTKGILEKLEKFRGFGIKQSKMYLLFLAKYNLAKLNTSEIGLPIDGHMINISYGCGVFDFEKGTRADKTRLYLDKMYSEIIKNEKIDSLALNSAAWAIGSKVCAKNNESSCKILCPLEEICGKNFPEIKRIDTRLYMKEPSRKNRNQTILDLF